MFLRQDLCTLAVVTEAAIDDLQRYLADVRYQRDAPVVAALCAILLLVEYHDDGMFHCCGISPPLQIQTTTISSSLRRKAESPVRVVLNSSTETPSGPTAFQFAIERMPSVNSCIVG